MPKLTLSPGGTSARILQASGPDGRLIAIDQDPHAIELARDTLKPYIANVSFHCGNFRDLQSILDSAGVSQVDGILFDLGISSAQLADADRGFSFQHDGPLDMRMNPSLPLTAEELVNTLPENELANARKVRLHQDALGRVIFSENQQETDSLSGHTIYLTIDEVIQYMADHE